MAALTKGISFRRQGSSGLIWADNWTFTDDGVVVMGRQKEGNFMRTPSRMNESMDTSSGSSMMGRSKSVGSSFHAINTTAAAQASNHKSGFRVVRWLKKAFTKMRG